jgi:hypothetical protein
MSKISKKRNTEDDPTVRAASITSSSAKKIAVITGICGIIAASVGGVWTWLSKTPVVEKQKIVGRVGDKTTGKPIKDAKVSIEGLEVPPVTYTDSEGVFSFPSNDLTKETRIRVERDGYIDYDRRLTPAEYTGNLDIRLEPSKDMTASQPLSISPHSSVPQAATLNPQKEAIRKYITEAHRFYENGNYDVALQQCKKALKLQPDNQEALQLKGKIENTIKILQRQ